MLLFVFVTNHRSHVFFSSSDWLIESLTSAVIGQMSLLWFRLDKRNKKLAIFNTDCKPHILLLSCPGRRLDDGAELDTSKAITPVSSLTAVDEGVVAVTWIP